jgi:UDP-N-acetyl-2-amino-2-deoxyglucuronate dehydrogenase
MKSNSSVSADRSRVRFALIGTGHFAPWFARYLNEVGELVAICDPSLEARARFFEATQLALPEFDDHEKLLAGVDFDAVAVTGPNHTHKQVTLAAAKAGKHVFCEKMMAPSVADCWEMVRACEAASVRLMVGHKRRLRPPWSRMIELRRELGEVVAISAIGYFDARNEGFGGWWTREAQSGGLLALSGVHELDWMRAMCGDVLAVSAIAAPSIDPRYDFSDSIQVTLKFRSGAVGSLGVSLSYPLLRYRQVCGAEVVTRKGGMRLVSSFQHVDLSWRTFEDDEIRHERCKAMGDDPVGVNEAFLIELGDFVRWITEGSEPCLTWREGLRCVELVEAARHSAKQGGAWISLPLYPAWEK